MSTVHTEHFRIRTSEINHRKMLHPHAMIQLMQEASMQHTISMKVSVWDLENMKASWVLLKMQVEILHFPTLNDVVKVETFPSGLDGYFTYRDYYMYDKEDNLCAKISSLWTLMHTESRKMMKIPESFLALVHNTAEKLHKPEFRLQSLASSDNFTDIKVNYFHLDWNGHINNVQLIRLMLESLESSFLNNMKLKSLSLHFKTEVMPDQEISIMHEIVHETTINHSIKQKETNKEVLLAVSEWERYG